MPSQWHPVHHKSHTDWPGIAPRPPTTINLHYFSIKPTRRKNFPNFILSKNSTCFEHFLCPSSGIIYCTFGTGISLAGWWQLPSKVLNLLGSCHQPARDIPVPNVQQITPDDGQRKCPKHVEFFDKIKFGKFVRLVGCIEKKFVMMHDHMNVK